MANENLFRGQEAEHDPGLVHIVHIFWQDIRVIQDGSNDIEPLPYFVPDVTIMTIPIQGLHSFGSKFWVTFVEPLRPILSWGLDGVIGG